MKILSLNSEHTLGEHQIAFNLNQELTPELMDLLRYGSLTLTAKGSILIVQIPSDSTELFSSRSLATLQGKLDEAQATLSGKAAKHLRMQQEIAQRIDLALH